MKRLIIVALLGLLQSVQAADRKAIVDVDMNVLISDSQVISGTNNTFDFIWWIPAEYWEVAFSQDSSVPQDQAQLFLGILRNYSVLAVLQADISAFGAFTFFDRERLMDGLAVEYVRADGKTLPIPIDEVADPDLRLLLDQLKPVLAAAMGSMGENFYFFPVPDTGKDGERLVSPYADGEVRVRLAARNAQAAPVLSLEFPLNALFVPRMCPNGKPAHISWSYCPWSGEKLP